MHCLLTIYHLPLQAKPAKLSFNSDYELHSKGKQYETTNTTPIPPAAKRPYQPLGTGSRERFHRQGPSAEHQTERTVHLCRSHQLRRIPRCYPGCPGRIAHQRGLPGNGPRQEQERNPGNSATAGHAVSKNHLPADDHVQVLCLCVPECPGRQTG